MTSFFSETPFNNVANYMNVLNNLSFLLRYHIIFYFDELLALISVSSVVYFYRFSKNVFLKLLTHFLLYAGSTAFDSGGLL